MSKNYNYIVGIDFGTFSTSFSYAHREHQDNIITIKKWPQSNTKDYDGRITSSLIYMDNIDSPPIWGESLTKSEYDTKKPLFYAPNIKPYLAGTESLSGLPEGLTPVKMVADYLKQLHCYTLSEMKKHFDLQFSSHLDDNSTDNTALEDQICYMMSIPDNQSDPYKENMKEALILAGIIKPDDPRDRVSFITESEATAYYCLKQYKPSSDLESLKPYLVCDIGGTVFGVSTIEVRELFETGKVSSHIDKSFGNFGNVDLNNNMQLYVDRKLGNQFDDVTRTALDEKLNNYFRDEIKQWFSDNGEDIECILDDLEIPEEVKSASACIRDNKFILPYGELKEQVFDQVTNHVIKKLEETTNKFSKGIGGVFLSGIIGETSYLVNRVREKLKTSNLEVHPVRSTFVISNGLVYYGFSQKHFTIPYIIDKCSERKSSFTEDSNTNLEKWKSTKFEGVDYIIGLDFGTTYSGFAYAAMPTGENKNDKNHNLIIKDVKSWPRQVHTNYPKIPSLLYYNETMKYQGKFGEEARYSATKRGGTKGVLLKNFKQLLSHNFKIDEKERRYANIENFEVVDAVAKFIKEFVQEGTKRIKTPPEKPVDKQRLGYVVTVPSAWSHEAKNTMKLAIKRAMPVPQDQFDSKVMFITEAEAGAIYCEKYFNEEFKMEQHQRFMICDAGGGTVDLATYEVFSDEKLHGELILSELTSSDYENVGSSYLDEDFRNYITQKLNDLKISYNSEGIDVMVNQFSKEIKTNFEPSLNPEFEDNIKIALPIALGIQSNFSDLSNGSNFIIDNEISISYIEIEEAIFKPLVDRILRLIEKQLKKMPEGERQLDAILIIGGFGQSSYLHKKIIDKFENKLIGAKFIGKPPNGDLAISRGAVSFGLEPRVVSTHIMQYTYGLQVKDHFKKKRDSMEYQVKGFNDELYCNNTFSPIVLKETKVPRSTVFIHRVYAIYPHDPIFALYATEDKYIPRLTTKLYPLYKITAVIPTDRGFQIGEKITFEVKIEITSTDIKVDVDCNNEPLKSDVIKTKSIIKIYPDSQEVKKTTRTTEYSIPVFISIKS